MGRNSSGVRPGSGRLADIKDIKEAPEKLYGLATMKDPRMYKETKAAIARFHSVLGVRERNIKLGKLNGNALGVTHLSSNGKSTLIVLNSEVFNRGYKYVRELEKRSAKEGFATKTNKPAAKTVTHELGHSLWNTNMNGTPNQRAATKEIYKMHAEWKSEKNASWRRKNGYGEYAETNVTSFGLR